jgi:hypothetical protein
MTRTIAAALSVVAVIVAACAWLLVSSFSNHSDTGYQVAMRPSAPLSHAACNAEIQRLRMSFANVDCSPGSDRPWFAITIRNVHDHNGFPVCRATAEDGAEEALFDQDVPIYVVGGEPSGPPVNQGTTLRLTWYFNQPTADTSYDQHRTWKAGLITHYAVSCHGRPDSQVPI